MLRYFSTENGQPREPALCQMYRHIFIPYDCRWLLEEACDAKCHCRHGQKAGIATCSPLQTRELSRHHHHSVQLLRSQLLRSRKQHGDWRVVHNVFYHNQYLVLTATQSVLRTDVWIQLNLRWQTGVHRCNDCRQHPATQRASLLLQPTHSTALSQLAPIAAAEVKVLSSMCLRASPLDVLPTALLSHSCATVYAPTMAHIANLPFTEGLQDCTDVAFAEEVWLVHRADATYRPISNLTTVSNRPSGVLMRR